MKCFGPREPCLTSGCTHCGTTVDDIQKMWDRLQREYERNLSAEASLDRRRKHHLQKANANRARANRLDKLYRLYRAKVRFYEAQIRDRFRFVDSEKVVLREEALAARNNALEEAKDAVQSFRVVAVVHGENVSAEVLGMLADAIENLKTTNPSPVRVRIVPKD